MGTSQRKHDEYTKRAGLLVSGVSHTSLLAKRVLVVTRGAGASQGAVQQNKKTPAEITAASSHFLGMSDIGTYVFGGDKMIRGTVPVSNGTSLHLAMRYTTVRGTVPYSVVWWIVAVHITRSRYYSSIGIHRRWERKSPANRRFSFALHKRAFPRRK